MQVAESALNAHKAMRGSEINKPSSLNSTVEMCAFVFQCHALTIYKVNMYTRNERLRREVPLLYSSKADVNHTVDFMWAFIDS